MYCRDTTSCVNSDDKFGVPGRCSKHNISDIDTESTCSDFSNYSRGVSFEELVTPVYSTSRSLPKPFWTLTRASSGLQQASPGVGPGDVLYVQNSSRNSLNVGVVGGFMGHVLVILSEPRMIQCDSEEANDLREVLPRDDVWPVLRARSMEATRSDSGLHKSEVFFHLAEEDGHVVMLGELNEEGEWVPYDANTTELWMAPPELRSGFRAELAGEVVEDMTAVEADWSLSTAVRALLRPADVGERYDTGAVLRELKDCWLQKPICTSIVIAFWQRYLVKLAELPDLQMDAASLLLEWMPLKADRALPTELLSVMARCGWSRLRASEDAVARSPKATAAVARAPTAAAESVIYL